MNKNGSKHLPINQNNIKYNFKTTINSNSNYQQTASNKKNIDENSLFNISYSSPKKQNKNILNNQIPNKKQNIPTYNYNNNFKEDRRLLYTLKMLGLSQYYMNFVQNKINFEGLLALSNTNMAHMRIPINSRKIIQNFILDYLQFGNLYSLEEIKQYFIKRNYNLKEYRNIRRSNSFNFQKNKTKKIINNINSQINLRTLKQNQYNNYKREFDKGSNNYEIINDNYTNYNNLRLAKSVSPSIKNNYNIYSKINMNSININNIENKGNNQYIMNYNNNNEYINYEPHNDINDLIINTNESNSFIPSLDNFNDIGFEEMKFDVNNMKHFYNSDNSMKIKLNKNQIRRIPQNRHSNSSKNIIQQLDKMLLKTLQRKKSNAYKLDYGLSNNKNIDIIDNKIENVHKGYYSDNNNKNNRNIIKNNIDDLTEIDYYLNNTTNTTNPNYTNNYYNLLNNYEINNFYGNNSYNTFLNKKNKYDNYNQFGSKSSLNSKSSKIKILKINQIKEVNQLLNNSKKNGINLYPISEKNRGLKTTSFNDYNFINKDIDSFSMNSNLNHNNFKIQNMKLNNKNTFYRNIDNYAYNHNNYNNFSYNQLSNNLNSKKYNTYNNNDANEIPDYPENNIKNNIFDNHNERHNFIGIMANSSNNKSINGLKIRYQEKHKPKKLFNNNSHKNLNIISSSKNNINYLDDTNNINANNSNFNIFENISNSYYINRINKNLMKSKNKQIKIRQNSSGNFFIKPIQQYYKTSNNFYNDQLESQSRSIAYSSVKKGKFNQIDNDSYFNILNQENKQYKDNKIIKRNVKKKNLPKYISKTQLEKIKLDIQKGFNKLNINNNKGNKKIKNYNYYSKNQNDSYSSNIKNAFQNIDDVVYQNNYLNPIYNDEFNSKNNF